jgi:hypothetical protein
LFYGLQAEAESNRLLDALREELGDASRTKLPADEDDLIRVANERGARVLAAFAAALHGLLELPTVAAAQTQLAAAVAQERARLLDRNVRVLSATCQDAFECAEAQLESERTCTLCLSRLSRAYYHSRARAAARDCFERQRRAQKVTGALREKVIQHWIDTTLEAKTNARFAQLLQLAVAVVAGLLGVIGWLLWKRN